MAKKTLSLKRERRHFLENCQALVSSFHETHRYLRVGVGAVTAMASQAPMAVTSGVISQTMSVPSVFLGVPEMLTLIQAAIVQEWQVYLDTIFEDAVAHILNIRDYSRIPSQMIDTRGINANSLVLMRQSLAACAREAFSFQPYEKKVHTICKMFGITSQGGPRDEIRLHIEMRNVLQHNRGMVRQSDLARIGKTYFAIRDVGSTASYGAGKRIVLTIHEVEALTTALDSFSKNFEVWK